MEEGLRLSVDDCPTPNSEAAEQMAPKKVVYMALVGAFLWLSNMTRHEISHVTSQLARFISNPGVKHFNAAMRVLIYLDNTRSRKLRYTPNVSLPLYVFNLELSKSWSKIFQPTVRSYTRPTADSQGLELSTGTKLYVACRSTPSSCLGPRPCVV